MSTSGASAPSNPRRSPAISDPLVDSPEPREPWRLNVLVVDDSDADRAWIAGQIRGMEEYEADVQSATSIAEASTLIAARPFDLALIDYRLSDGYGDALIAVLGQSCHACATILVSGHAMAEVSLFGVRAGATAAIAKDDLSPGLLETTIRFALANRARMQSR